MKLPFYAALKRQFEKQIDARGLALFRIGFALVLLQEIRQIRYFQHLIYDQVPFLQPGEIDLTITLRLWQLTAVCLVFGLFTRWAAVISYILSLVFIATIQTYEYHMFYAYMGVNFLLMFLPVSRTWSIDRLLEKLRYSSARFQYIPPRTVNQLSYTLPVFVAIGLVYFDSVFYKTWSESWMAGLGLWLPSVLPMTTTNGFPWLLDQEWLVRGLGFLTVIFELVFIFLMWYRWSRWPFFILGMGLHIGILVYFPIPWFALGVIAIYFLVVPVASFRWLESLFKPKPGLKFFYDQECPLCVRTKIVISHFDALGKVEFLPVQVWHEKEKAFENVPFEQALNSIYSLDAAGRLREGFDTYVQVFRRVPVFFPLYLLCLVPGISFIGRKIYGFVAANREVQRCTDDNCGYAPPVFPQNSNRMKVLRNLYLGDLKFAVIYGFICLMIVLQVLISWNSGIVVDWRRNLGLGNTAFDAMVRRWSWEVHPHAKHFLGFTNHPVFMDVFHFNGYNHEIKVNYVDGGKLVNVPIINEDGTPGPYCTGFNWVKWTFRVVGPQLDHDRITKGIKDYTAFWAGKNHIGLDSAEFRIFVRHIHNAGKWESGFLAKQMQHPWIPAGKAHWKNKEFVPDLRYLSESGLDSIVSGKAKVIF